MMFEDREQELDRLNRQLLEEAEEEEECEEEEYEEEYDEDAEAVSDYEAFNSDTTDVDLEEYSDRVYREPPSRKGILAAVLLATAVVLLFLAYLLAKKGGLL